MPFDLTALYNQGINLLLQRAAEWARIPTRLNRAAAALQIVQQAAVQKTNQEVFSQMDILKAGLQQVRTAYDNGSAKVADVVDAVRALPPGSIPPVSLAPKAAEVVATIAAVTAAVANIERTIVAAAPKVLTQQQVAQLNSGMQFTSYMGTAVKQVVKYVALGVGGYFVLKAFMRSEGTKRF